MAEVQPTSRELLNYSVEGDGPAVLLLHPVGLDITSWDEVAGRLRAYYRVLRVDLRGHGKSSLPKSSYTLSDYAEDVHQVLLHTGLHPAGIVGLSLGGMVAQVLTLRHPADAAALVLAGTVATQEPQRKALSLARAEAAEDGGMVSVVESTIARWFSPDFIAAGKTTGTRDRLYGNQALGWASAWRAMADLNTAHLLSKIGVPTLCVAGERDQSIPPSALENIAASIPNARFALLSGAPHMMQIEMPAAFAETVLAFLLEVLPVASR